MAVPASIRSKYEPVIGLEIHAELKTASKMFCGCANNPDEERPNSNVCPVCLGHPGTLPILNMEAIRQVLKVALAVNGKIADFTEWDRKNYFYPDIPKGYQLSQYKYPLVSGGRLAGVSLERIHLEEDTARSTHDSHKKSLVDFNRSGVPLLEIVTKPDIHDAATAVAFGRELQLLLRYLGAGDANMEKGEMRVEANISVSPVGDNPPSKTSDRKLGTKTEVKNLNSFRAIGDAIEYEIGRQIETIENGKGVVQETRGWDDVAGKTFSQRSKESSHDYRYFPDPDIPKLKISEVEEFSSDILVREISELPWTKRERYRNDFGMTEKEVAVFVESPALSDYFEKIISSFSGNPKRVRLATNYLLTDYLGSLKKMSGGSREGMPEKIPPGHWSELIEMIDTGDLSSRGAKEVIVALLGNGGSGPRAVAEKHSLIQRSDTGDLLPLIEKVLSEQAKVVAEYKAGKTASLQFLIGQAMRAGKGATNPDVIKRLLLEKLG